MAKLGLRQTMTGMKTFGAMMLALLIGGICRAGQFHVVTGGRAVCQIEVAADADHVVKLAADELKKWIGEITDASLDIVAKADGPCIELAVSKEIPELSGNDGYAIRTDGQRFSIIGSCPKGVLNGVFKVLYRNTDIIWARPDEKIGTIFTKKDSVSFEDGNMVDVPVYKQRGWQMECGVEREANSFWQTRNCSNWMTGEKYIDKFGCIKEFGGGHNLCGMYLPPSIYYKDHADFYPLIDGVRVKHAEMPGGCQLCFTNPEMTKEFIRRLDEFVQKNMDRTVFRVMLEDNYHLCCCPKCMEPITLPDGTVLDGRNLKVQSQEWKVWRSTQFFLWYNQLAAFMKEKYPDKRLLSFAYFFTEFAPKIAIPDNVDISFCPIYRDSKHLIDEPENKVVMDTVNEWLTKTKFVTWREYYGINTEFPRPIDRVAFHDYALLAKKGMSKTYSELIADTAARAYLTTGVRAWDLGAPYLWSLVQAPWNPNRNVEDVRREYYTRVFGAAAAPEVEAMYATFEKGWYAYPGKSVWNDSAARLWKNCYAKQNIDDEVKDHLKKALTLVNNPKGKVMLERISQYLEGRGTAEPAAAIVIPKAKGDVPFEAVATAPAWKDALTMTEFYDANQIREKYPTVMKFLHDGTNLYASLHAERKGIDKMLDERKNYCQTEVFNVFVQLSDERFPEYFHIMVDPINRIYASAGDNRQVPEFKFKYTATHGADSWDCLVVIPLSQLPKTHKIAAFRRYNSHDRAAEWPMTGPGFKNAILHEVDTFAPFTLGE
ncbi:MAG: DUF4838 domain-containing protein [Victivallales bacterium]|nr:DUF4838 domain-containing protein [Victivallales bacterium]